MYYLCIRPQINMSVLFCSSLEPHVDTRVYCLLLVTCFWAVLLLGNWNKFSVHGVCLCWLQFAILRWRSHPLLFISQGKPFTSIEPSTDINDMCLYPDSGKKKSYFKICHMLHCKLHVFLFAPRLSIAWLLSTPSYTCTLYFHCMSLLGFIKGELNDSSNLGCVNVLQLKKKHACKLLIS